MTNSTSVLVPVAILQGEALSEALVDLLSNVEVTLLGYHELPDQTATEQAHDQFNEQMQQKLAEYVDLLVERGGTVTSRTVFTHDAPETFKRIAIEQDIAAILVPNPAPTINRILVPIRGPVNLDPILTMIAALIDDTETEIVLFHAAPSEASRADGDQLLATAADNLQTAGIDTDRISRRLTVSETPLRAVGQAAIDTEFVVIGEKEPSVVDIIFGDAAERIADISASPVLVVRTERSETD